jgi:hypothetical protein
VGDNGNCSGYERAIAICAINLACKRVNKSSEPNLQASIEGTGDYHGSQRAGPSCRRHFCRVVSRNVGLGSPLQDHCFSRERQLGARTSEVKAATGLKSSASSAFRFVVARSEDPAAMPAWDYVVRAISRVRRAHLGAPPPIAQAATVFEE